MYNKVIIIGRLTATPELHKTNNEKSVTRATVAVNRRYKDQNGEREADFINIVIWRQQAENLANWAKKGALIGITGRIQTRNYENQQGQRVYVTEVVADNFQLLESRSNREGQSSGGYGGNSFGGSSAPSYGSADSSNQVPNFSRDESPFGNSNPMDISDDDLPF